MLPVLTSSPIQESQYKGIPIYDNAYSIFCGFIAREVEDKEFRDHLLHEEYGLCVYVITVLDNRYILQNDTVDTSKFLLELDQLLSKDLFKI